MQRRQHFARPLDCRRGLLQPERFFENLIKLYKIKIKFKFKIEIKDKKLRSNYHEMQLQDKELWQVVFC